MGVVHDQRPTQIKVKEESSPIPILPQPSQPTTTLIITAPLNTVQSSNSDPVSLRFFFLVHFAHLLHDRSFELGLSFTVIYCCFLAEILINVLQDPFFKINT